MKILVMMFKGIKNVFIIKSARIIVGIALLITIVSLLAIKEASWTKTFLVFGTVPTSLFISGHFNKKNDLVEYKNYDQVDYEENTQSPYVDRIEKKTITTTTETIYFKNADIKHLENFNWRD
ncbi:MAG: hypothetical protein PHP92_05175 [Candidatus Nanoarchaeia archaeon]|nr:hypothetical protein [Candidatus Nanoarchaeia archaeon]